MKSKIAFILLLSLIIIVGCGKKKKKTTINKGPMSEVDTFYLGERQVKIDRIGKAIFDDLASSYLDTAEAQNLLKDSAMVKRKGDTLFFAVANNRTVTLVNNKSDGEDYSDYSYYGYMKDIKQYIIYGSFYEWYNYMLIDQETGDTTVTCGEPVVSPDKRTFICGNSDLTAGFTFNGLELYENSHKPKLISSRELGKWGPEKIKWADNNTLMIECSVSDTTKENLVKTDYYKLTIH